jgi:hypothetical protein
MRQRRAKIPAELWAPVVKSSLTEAKEGASLLFGTHHQRPEWELARRVVSTPPFLRSAFLTNFLLYVCDRKLRGRESEISEHQIGIQALGRPPSYHPGEDNIVRNYARILRKRLEEYFAEEGANEPIRIVIPRGQYAPVFEANAALERVESPALAAPPPVARRLSLANQVWIAVAVLLLCLSAGWMYWSHTQAATLYDVFWRELFEPRRTTYVVAADSGFAMLQDMTGQEVHLDEYVLGNMDKQFPTFAASDRAGGEHYGAEHFADYTSVADLNAVVGLLRLPESSAGSVVVRYARDMRMDDVKQSNLILLGGPHANPWVELFEPASEFHMMFNLYRNGTHLDQRSIMNKQPRLGEQATYRNIPDGDTRLTYTILSFLPSVDGIGHALLIQGQNMAGTRAGADFVLNPRALTPILKKARMKNGEIGRFEVVLETQAVGASAPEARPIVERYGVTR